MAIALWLFLLWVSLYHVIVTVLVYGLWIMEPETIVVIREGVWFVIVMLALLFNYKRIGSYIRATRKIWLIFIVMCAAAVTVSYIQQKTNTDILVWAKYGLQFFVVFLTATFLGHVISYYPQRILKGFLHQIFVLLLIVFVLWLVWQGAKMLWPELFYQIGYAPFGDRVFGKNPPLYYLTGPDGYARLSGIFSWPNNYGYLFVAMFGFRWWYMRNHIQHRGVRILLWSLFAASVLWTMSRGAILGIFLQLIALSFVFFHAKRKSIWWLVIAWVVVVGALSLIKRWSTLAHVSAKFSSLSYVRANPLGYWLGSSGPSIHTGHGTILPENFFVQILLDIGIPGLILWLLFWYLVLKNIWTLRKQRQEKSPYMMLLVCLSFSFLGLMLEGMFLHVFEDSMVNYWFFILRGVIYWYVQKNEHKAHS